MNKKQLAEMIKEMRAKKLQEVAPESIRAIRQKQDTNVGGTPGTGSRFDPIDSTFTKTVGAVEKRVWQKSGNQARTPNSYVVAEDGNEKELGDTDTGQKTKKKTETIDVNPTIKDIAGGGLTATKDKATK